MAVITISREFGSGGASIAREVAQQLGYHYVDRNAMARMLERQGVADFGTEYDAVPPAFWAHFDARRVESRGLMVNILNQLILALARHGNAVILGRGGFAVLGGLADVLNVRIQAPLPQRVKWVMEKMNVTRAAEAEAMVKEGDRVRATFVESFYGVRWDTAQGFDLMIDTCKIAPERATAWLVDAAKALPAQAGHEARTSRLIAVDINVTAAVNAELKCQVAHGH